MRGAWRQLLRYPLTWVALTGLVGLAAGWYVLTRAWFVYPHRDEVEQVDAVVVLSGSERVRAARDLMAEGVSATLAVSYGAALDDVDCAQEEPYEVICFEPAGAPSGTLGEARAVRALAEEHGWRRIAVVTSDYHVFRSGLLFRRCTDTEVAMVPVPSRNPPWRVVLQEQGKLIGTLPYLVRC